MVVMVRMMAVVVLVLVMVVVMMKDMSRNIFDRSFFS